MALTASLCNFTCIAIGLKLVTFGRCICRGGLCYRKSKSLCFTLPLAALYLQLLGEKESSKE
jgi:hypothetical protein